MNVYEIGEYTIASENPDQALGVYMEETNSLDNYFIGELEEGESEEITITIKRLIQKKIQVRNMECCEDGDCKWCEDKGEVVYISLQDVIDDLDEHAFPCVIAKEE